MTAKTFEIRDRMTFIPVLAVRLEPGNEQDRYLLARSGFGPWPHEQREYVLLAKLYGGEGTYHHDPATWDGGTMPRAHEHIIEHFTKLESGSVVDVEFLRGETAEPKRSEAVET